MRRDRSTHLLRNETCQKILIFILKPSVTSSLKCINDARSIHSSGNLLNQNIFFFFTSILPIFIELKEKKKKKTSLVGFAAPEARTNIH